MRFLPQPWVKIVVASVCVGAFAQNSAAAAARTYAGAAFVVTADGVPAFTTKDAGGGNAVGTVVVEPSTAFGQFRKKHLAGVKYEDIALGVGIQSSPGLIAWMSESLRGNRPAKNGSITTCDYDYNQVSKLSWVQGTISAIDLPELDASSKVAGDMKVGITAQRTARSGSGGKAATASLGSKQKAFIASNFRISIDGLDLTRVNHIDPLSVRLKSVTDTVGAARDYEKTPGTADVSNLVFTIDEAHSSALQSWYDSFVVRGDNGQNKERSGRIELLATDMKTVLLTVGLHGLGIVELSPAETRSAADTISRLRAELYVEYVTLEPAKG